MYFSGDFCYTLLNRKQFPIKLLQPHNILRYFCAYIFMLGLQNLFHDYDAFLLQRLQVMDRKSRTQNCCVQAKKGQRKKMTCLYNR